MIDRLLDPGSAPNAAIALGLLAITRPYEGLVLAIALLVISRPRFDRAHVIGAMTAIVALVPLAFYNRAVTGSAVVLPYSIYEERYDPVPTFLWQSPRSIALWPNKEMEFNYKVIYGSYYRRVM